MGELKSQTRKATRRSVQGNRPKRLSALLSDAELRARAERCYQDAELAMAEWRNYLSGYEVDDRTSHLAAASRTVEFQGRRSGRGLAA
jgi:hypothetical protein